MSGSKSRSEMTLPVSKVNDRGDEVVEMSPMRVAIPVPTPEQRQYLDELQRVSSAYDPDLIVGGPCTVNESQA